MLVLEGVPVLAATMMWDLPEDSLRFLEATPEMRKREKREKERLQKEREKKEKEKEKEKKEKEKEREKDKEKDRKEKEKGDRERDQKDVSKTALRRLLNLAQTDGKANITLMDFFIEEHLYYEMCHPQIKQSSRIQICC